VKKSAGKIFKRDLPVWLLNKLRDHDLLLRRRSEDIQNLWRYMSHLENKIDYLLSELIAAEAKKWQMLAEKVKNKPR
jgi:hypothetical protein